MPLDGSNWPTAAVAMSDALDRAADLVQRGWCQGNLSVNWFGWPCSPYSMLARRYCARGAIQRALWELDLIGDLTSRELEVARELLVVAPKTMTGQAFLMAWEWENVIESRRPSDMPTDVAAIERWNDNDRIGSWEVIQLFRFTAKELRGAA